MIISISGRKRAGKSTIANYLCNERGFIKASFADFLKNLVCHAFNIDRNYLETVKDKKEFSLVLNDVLGRIREYCNIPNNYDFEIKSSLVFSSYREVLQYIGSELIRKYDNNFHVKIMENFLHENSDKDICVDDTRFPNELQLLKKMDGLCYFIIRPNYFDVSNHQSETSLRWKDFDEEYIMINDVTEKKFIKKFKDHLDAKNKDTKYDRKYFIELLEKFNYDTKAAANSIHCSTDKIVWWCNRFNIKLSKKKYTSDNSAFLEANDISAYYAGLISADGCIKKSGKSKTCYVLELSSTDKCLVEGLKKYCESNKPIYETQKSIGKKQYAFVVNNPYIIENIKYWDLEPRKSKNNKIPSVLKINQNFINDWIVGLIDGDGSVYTHKMKRCQTTYITISVLGSKEVLDFIIDHLSISPTSYGIHKKIEELYEIKYFYNKAIEIYRKLQLSSKYGLKRKWDKFIPFLQETK
jgi:hypothetical protein